MKSLTTSFLLLVVYPLLCFTGCKEKSTGPDPELTNVELLRGDIIMCSGKKFGDVGFSSTCKSSVREAFNLAVSLLHSFEYDEAEKAFVKVIDVDPNCAMAYWGVAMSIYHTLWEHPGEKQLKKGSMILKIARSIPKTKREQDYLDAIGTYFNDWETVDAKTRSLRMTEKMEEMYLTYKEDTEAAIFYALALNSTADPTDKTYRNQRKAGSILESLFPDQPNHPGIAHYIIHNYDNPVLAEKALSTARKYAEIAPASSHAQHMPSHIFTRLGIWDEAVSSNLDASSSAICYAESAGFDGHWDEELHAMDYLVYAYLQMGEVGKAKEQNLYLNTIKKVYPPNFKVAYAFAAIPARIALENKDWDKAANLELSPIEVAWEQFPWQKSILHFTRALGASHLGKTDQAQKEIESLEALHQELVEKDNSFQANQVFIQIKAAKAWLNFAKGKNSEALSLMRDAADMEDQTSKHPVTPGEVLPARELLGDMYLAMNQPSEALLAYEQDLKDHPNRLNGLYGAATAYKNLGNTDEANRYFEKLLKLPGSVEVNRPEIKAAREALRKI